MHLYIRIFGRTKVNNKSVGTTWKKVFVGNHNAQRLIDIKRAD